MNWWMWAILGFVLLVAEMLTPGTFYLMFLGISALIVAAAVDDLIGEFVTLREPLAPGQTGDAELRGTTWKARNSGTAPLSKGGRYKVSGVDGLTVVVTGDVHGKGGQQ